MSAIAASIGALLIGLGAILLVVFVLFPRDYFGCLVGAIILGISGIVVWRAAILAGRAEKRGED